MLFTKEETSKTTQEKAYAREGLQLVTANELFEEL